MASDREMTLMLSIRARGENALAELRKFEHGMNGIFDGLQRKAGIVGGTFRTIGNVGGMLLAPLKYALLAGGALVGVLAALGGKALLAAAGDEKFIERLAAMTGSLESARKQWDMLEATSRRGPFSAEDLGEAWISLNHIGMASRKNLGILARSARVAGGNVADMARSITALQMRSLKAFGIEFETKGEGYELKYFDRANKLRTRAYKDAQEARKGLVEFLGEKFGSGFEPHGLTEAWQTFKNNMASLWSTVGTPMLAGADEFVRRITDRLRAWIEGGGAQTLGERVAGFLDRALTNLSALMEVLPRAFAAIRATMEGAGANFATLLTDGAGSAGRIFGVAVVEYLGALKDVLVGLAGMMASVFTANLANLPGMGPWRHKQGLSALEDITTTPEGAEDAAGREAIEALQRKHGLAKGRAGFEQLRDEMTPEIATDLIRAAGGRRFARGMAQATGAIPTALGNIGATVGEEGRFLAGRLKAGSGYDFGADFRATQWRMREEAALRGTAQVTARMTEYAQEGANPLRRHAFEAEMHRLMSAEEAGKYHIGQRLPSGAVIVNIQQLDVHASDAERVMNDLIAQAAVAGSPGT
jgi:hypothetical protein